MTELRFARVIFVSFLVRTDAKGAETEIENIESTTKMLRVPVPAMLALAMLGELCIG